MINFLRATWLIACVAVLWLTLATYVPRTKEGDAAVFFALTMTLLTFPSGLIVIGLAAILSMSGEQALLNSQLYIVVFWALLVCIGYSQWFVFIPKFVQRIRLFWAANSVRQRR
jgi:hypothetical protein